MTPGGRTPNAEPRAPNALVAVTASTRLTEDVERVRLNVAYLRALEQAGLVPLVVAPLAPALAPRVLAGVQGLVLTGGEDVAPHRFGAAPHPALGTVHEGRDAWELALVAAAHERKLPTLAICRGIQVLNVALGGTLVQDLPSERPAALAHETENQRATRVHEVRVEPGSCLARALGTATLRVNSMHHQSLDRVAPGLRVTGTSPDGIIEGAEWRGDDWWALGVQWHPEELTGDSEPWDAGLFAEFARVVRGE